MRFTIIAISLLLASCDSVYVPNIISPHKIEIQQGNKVAAEKRDQLKLGMSTIAVRALLGTPLLQDPFHADRWDYVYSLHHEGKLMEKQRLTLYFKDGFLSSIDDTAMPTEAAKMPKKDTEQGKHE